MLPGPLYAEALTASGNRAEGKGLFQPCTVSLALYEKRSFSASWDCWSETYTFQFQYRNTVGLELADSKLVTGTPSLLPVKLLATLSALILIEPSSHPGSWLCAMPFCMALFSTFLFFYLRHVYPKTEYSQGLYYSSKTTVLDLIKIFSTFRSKIYHCYVPIDIYHIWFLSGPYVSYHLELMN